jgi:hypothetical protein
MSADSDYYQICAGCGARYEVTVTKKVAGTQDERVVCDCGWPLKEWIGIKSYIFKRIPAKTATVHSK